MRSQPAREPMRPHARRESGDFMLGRTDSWLVGRARRGFAFILGGVAAALLLQGQPALAQEVQSSPSSTDASDTAGSTATPSTDTSTSSATVAAPQAQAAAATSSDEPVESTSLRPAEESTAPTPASPPRWRAGRVRELDVKRKIL